MSDLVLPTAAELAALTDDEVAELERLLIAEGFGVEVPWVCPRAECDGEPHGGGWPAKHARTGQRPPPGFGEPDGPRLWYLKGGRGSGKTRAGAEVFAERVWDSGAGQYAVIAPEVGAARDVNVEGESGLLAVFGPVRVRRWNRSLGELTLTNGAWVKTDGAQDGAPGIQGLNLRGVWADEVGLWSRTRWRRAWHEGVRGATRKGNAWVICTGTPKQGHPLVLHLVAEARSGRAVMGTLRTADNVANLSAEAVADLEREYGGTRQGQQELEGEILEDVPGALWSWDRIEELRVEAAPELLRVAIGVDPTGGDGERADEVGIVVCGRGADGHGYTLADLSERLSPDRWGKRVVEAYAAHGADVIVAEANFGGQMVEQVIRRAAADLGIIVRVKLVTASRGKRVRAEPVAQLSEQGREHHVGKLPTLEHQLCNWDPLQGTSKSPDRLDAKVWALTELMPARTATPALHLLSISAPEKENVWR